MHAPAWTLWCIGIGALLMLASAGGLVTGGVLLERYTSSLHRADLLPEGVTRTGGQVTGPLNILLVGSDYRRGLENEAWRSDTIMILHVAPTLDQAFVLSIPRDLQVQIPRCPDSESGCLDKVNAAFAYGGAGPPFDQAKGYRLLAATLHDLTGLRFDAAAVIDFSGFAKLVEAIGGVRLCVDVETTSIHTGMTWQPGCQVFQGHQALDYVRQRDFPDGDVTRQRHQQQFIKAVLEQGFDSGTLTDPRKLDKVLRAAGDSLTVDTAYAPADLLFALRDLRPSGLVMLQLPVAWDWIGGVSYALPTERTTAMLAALRDGDLASFTVRNPDLVNR